MDFMTRFVDILDKTEFDDLHKDVVEKAKLFILDTLGVGIAGSSEPGCREVVDMVKELGGKPEATIMCYGGKVPTPWAVLANSTMMHALDFDDALDEVPLHANISVLPTALALAETQEEANGKDLINAVVLGNEIICRLGLAAKIPPAFVRTVTCGSFGAAATAAKILKLDRDKMLNTLGIVYSQTAGNAQCVLSGALVKRMQPAMAAKAGVVSALLAKKGVTGARDIFEGKYGYFSLYERGEYNRDLLFDDLGKNFEQMKLSIKPYPSCRYTHAAIDAAIDLVKKYPIETENIDKIVVYTSKMVKEIVGHSFEIHENPQVDAQFSIPYTISIALMHGNVSLNDFQVSAIRDGKVLKLAKKIEVVVDSAIDDLSLMKAKILIKTKDEKSYIQETAAPKGSPKRPMSVEECINKFISCIHYNGNIEMIERGEQLIDCITHLEEISDIRMISNLLA